MPSSQVQSGSQPRPVLVEHPDQSVAIASPTATIATASPRHQADCMSAATPAHHVPATVFSMTLPAPRAPSKKRAVLHAAAAAATLFTCGAGAALGAYFGIRGMIGRGPACQDTGHWTAYVDGVDYTCSNYDEVSAFANHAQGVKFAAFLAAACIGTVAATLPLPVARFVCRRGMVPQYPETFSAV